MPIPNPTSSEKSGKEGRQKFISRCMESLKNEKRDQNQKLAICFETYKQAKKKKESKGCFDCEPEWDELQIKNGGFDVNIEIS